MVSDNIVPDIKTNDMITYWILGIYVAIVIIFGTWAIVRAKKSYREHRVFLKDMKIGDEIMYRNLNFEIIDTNTRHGSDGVTTAIKISTEGWLYIEDFGLIRPRIEVK